MPFKNTDYSKTIIYKIVSNDLNIRDVYVGSTTNFRARKSKHKTSCLNINSKEYNYKLYQFIRENGNWINFSMIEIEKYSCKDNNEARARERYWFEQLNSNLNMRKPLSTEEEKKEYDKEYNKKYQDDHKEYLKEYNKQYKDEHIDELKQKQQENLHCSCGSIITKGSKSKHEKTFKHISKTQSLFSS